MRTSSPLIDALIVLGAIVLVVLGVLAARAARERALESQPARTEDLLAPLEAAYRRGLMDDAEYQRVRRSLEGGEAHKPERPPPAPPPPEPAPQDSAPAP